MLRGLLVIGVGAVGEDLEEGEVRDELGRLGEGLNLWSVEEFGKKECVRVGRGTGDEIGCCSGRGRGLGER